MWDTDETEPTAISGWVEDWSIHGVRVGRRWVPWAIGGIARPRPGEHAEVALDDAGCAVAVEVRAFRPVTPSIS
jgi:hypothetical protein